MLQHRTATSAALAASTALVLGAAALGTTGCGNDRIAADARRTLGTQLGTTPATSVAGGSNRRQAASADDLMAARRYLEATLRLDPTNAGARAALAGLGGAPDADLSIAAVEQMPGPVASRAPGAHTTASFGEVAVGAVGAIGTDVADAVRPWATRIATSRTAGAAATDSGQSITAIVATRPAGADSASGDSASRTRPGSRSSTRGHVAAVRRRGALELETAIAARDDSIDAQHADNARDSADATAGRATATKAKHKRTWPWTRAQRWLVAKGIGGGAGAGVVVGALIGNVPGALIAGSLGGGALGFHKATKIGPAAPYPSKADSVAFDANKQRHNGDKSKQATADTSAKVAVARP